MIRGVAKIVGGIVKQLEGRAEPDQQVTEADVQEPAKLARLLTSMLKDVAGLKRRVYPRRIDFEDIAFDGTGTKLFPLSHRFNGRVRWWPVDWVPGGGGGVFVGAAIQLAREPTTDKNTLVLVSYLAGTATIRVEEAG